MRALSVLPSFACTARCVVGVDPAVVADGHGRIAVRVDPAPIDLTPVVIDYYR